VVVKFFLYIIKLVLSQICKFDKNLVPTARVGIAHGRMKAEEIETVTMAFLEEK